MLKHTLTILMLCLLAGTSFAGSLENIMKTHESRVSNEKKTYDSAVKRITADTIRRLEVLKRAITRQGKLEEAVAIQNQINALKGEAPMNAADEKAEVAEVGMPDGPATLENETERQTQKKLSKRVIAFFQELVDNDVDKALSYLDPDMRRLNGADKILKGYLQILAGHMKINNISKNGIDVQRVKFTKRRKEAKVVPRYRKGMGEWHESDPSYWVYKHGDWYLGDEKELKKKF